MTNEISMPVVEAPLSTGHTVTGFTGVTITDVAQGDQRIAALSIVQPDGSVLGVLMDDAAFDCFCAVMAPLVEARRFGTRPGKLPQLDAAHSLQ